MKLIVHQAVYGDLGGRHGLLASSGGDGIPYEEVLFHSDLPGHLPSGAQFPPYLSGRMIGAHYVLAQTALDPHATRRGMARTHALIVDAPALSKVANLRPLLALLDNELASVADRPAQLQPFRLVEEQLSDAHLPAGAEVPGLPAVVLGLLGEASTSRPVVWIGVEGFDEIVVALWRVLWPEVRHRFAFRLSFSPQDLGPYDKELGGIRLVSTPVGLATRWSGFVTVHSESTHEALTPKEAFLLHLPGGKSLRVLQKELGYAPPDLTGLRDLERAAGYLEELDKTSSARVMALTQLVGHLSPKPELGRSVKARVLDRLQKVTKKGDAKMIRRLRNFEAGPYEEEGWQKISAAVEQWVEENIFELKQAKEHADLVALAFSSHSADWNNALQDALERLLRAWPNGAAPALWAWWTHKPELVDSIGQMLPKETKVEGELVAACPPNLPSDVSDFVRRYASRRKWYVLHAAAAVAALPPVAALNAQLQIDRRAKRDDGLRLIAERADAPEVVEVAVASADERLLRLAGDASAQDPDLLKSIDITQPSWRRLWQYSIAGSQQSPWVGIPDPATVMSQLVSLVIDGESIDEAFLLRLADSPYGDISEHPRRREAWATLPPTASQLFISRTADGWLE